MVASRGVCRAVSSGFLGFLSCYALSSFVLCASFTRAARCLGVYSWLCRRNFRVLDSVNCNATALFFPSFSSIISEHLARSKIGSLDLFSRLAHGGVISLRSLRVGFEWFS